MSSTTINQNMDSGELHLIIGPMMSGKSTELLRRLFNESVIGLKCIYINHLNDTRSTEGFSTHNPLYKEKLSKESGVTFVSAKDLSDVDVTEYDIVGVDESQFFNNLLRDILYWVDDKHKTVIVSGLNGDKKRTAIGYINGLIPHMDSCTFLKAYCQFCADKKIKRNAIFTHKFGGGDDIGGKDKYAPLCRECFNKENA
jgi:thymidine kinase